MFWVPSEPTRTVQQIRHAYLMRREPRGHGGGDLSTVEPDEAPRALLGPDGIDENHRVGCIEIREQRKTKRAAIEHSCTSRDVVPLEKKGNGRGANPVILEQHVPKPEHDERFALIHRLDRAG